MSLIQDILATFRATPARPSSNWRGYHAAGAFVLGAAFSAVGAWATLFADVYAGVGALGLGALFLALWRHLLPSALWYSKVERTLRGD